MANQARTNQINAALTREECSICRIDLFEPVSTVCRHVFCKACVTRWLERNSTCLVCRHPVLPQEQVEDAYDLPDGGNEVGFDLPALDETPTRDPVDQLLYTHGLQVYSPEHKERCIEEA